MARNPKKNPTAPGRKTRSVRPARRMLTEVERVRRFLLDSGFRKMTAEEMRRSPVVAALESLALPKAKPMTLKEIKKALEALGPTERSGVLAFLVRRRLLDAPSYRVEVDRRSADSDPNHWLKPEQFEQRLEDLLRARLAQAKAGDMSPHSVSDIWAEVRDRRTR